MAEQARLCQVALSVGDVRRSQRWYRDALGMEPSGGTNAFAGPLATMVQGVPRAASTCWWLVDRQDRFQIELFEFRSPPTRALPPDWRPCDIGYTTIGVHVADFDAAVAGARAAGSAPLSEPVGAAGGRRVCVRDPDGVLIELMEDDPRAPRPRARPRENVPAVVRSITLSVPDLERSMRMFVDVFGLEPDSGPPLHGAEHEDMWGLTGAGSRRVALWADDILIELAQYETPLGKPWPDGYRISDRGLLNIAFGFRDRVSFERRLRRCRDAGLEANGPPLRAGAASVTYVNDPDGFSIELLHARSWFEAAAGFSPRATPRLAPFAGRNPSMRGRGRPFEKAVITGAAGRICTELARLCAADGTDLVLMDRDEDGLEATAAELRNLVSVECIAVDFADLESLDEVAASLAERHPDIDLLLAGAGVDRGQSMLNFDWRQARDDFEINTLANLVLMQRLLPGMVVRGRGHVTAIASLAAHVGTPYEGVYSATKAALAKLMDSARGELRGTGVTFTTAFPGFIDTPLMWANVYKHPYVVPLRDAAERIYASTLKRRATVAFPARERARIALGGLLPTALRDRLAKDAMDPDAARRLGESGRDDAARHD